MLLWAPIQSSAAQGFNPEPRFPYEQMVASAEYSLDVGAVVATAIAATEVRVVGRIVVGG
jgi:hypothetical protein